MTIFKLCQNWIRKILESFKIKLSSKGLNVEWSRYHQSGQTPKIRKLWHEALTIELTVFLLSGLHVCLILNEKNIKVILFLLKLGIYSSYLVMLIKNLIFMYLSQRKYHFIKIQLDSDNIWEDYRITAVWT
jgi:hypothetical protein